MHYNIYVTELWTRRYRVDAASEEEAIAAVEGFERDGPNESVISETQPSFEATFAPDGSEIDGKALAWSVEPLVDGRGLAAPAQRWRIDYTVRDGDDKRDETAHDVEAPTAGEALTRFLHDQLGSSATTLGELHGEVGRIHNMKQLQRAGWRSLAPVWAFGDAMTVRPLSLHLWHAGRIIEIRGIGPETSTEGR